MTLEEGRVVQVRAWKGDGWEAITHLPVEFPDADRYEVTVAWPDNGFTVGQGPTYEEAIRQAREAHQA